MDYDLLSELRNEAIDSSEDRIASLEGSLKGFLDGHVPAADAFAAVKLEAHSLKSIAASFEMKALRALCHRFEDFIFIEKTLTPELAKRMQFFVDQLSVALEAWKEGRELDISQLMRTLPAKGAGGGFDVADVNVADVEVMLVMEPGTATKIVTRELVECGYRMVNVAATMDAIQLIPVMRPDLVIVSRVMPELSGVDLACALKAMPTTRSIPVAMIASVDGEQIQDLPKDVPILRKGGNFGDDVADVFMELGIL